jgi:hypothetical protein
MLLSGTTLYAWARLRLFRGGFHLHTARSQLEVEDARSKPIYYGILSGRVSLYSSDSNKTTKTKLHGLSPQANYTDRLRTAACRRS